MRLTACSENNHNNLTPLSFVGTKCAYKRNNLMHVSRWFTFHIHSRNLFRFFLLFYAVLLCLNCPALPQLCVGTTPCVTLNPFAMMMMMVTRGFSFQYCLIFDHFYCTHIEIISTIIWVMRYRRLSHR